MTTGFYRNDGYDLDQLFMAGSTGVSGYPFTFQAYVQGAQQGATGFKNAAGTDLSQLFQNINVPLYTNIYGVGVNHAPNNSDPNPYYYCMSTQYGQCPFNVNLNTGWMTIYGSGGYSNKWVSGADYLSGSTTLTVETSGVLVRFTRSSVGRMDWYDSTYRVYLTDGTSTGSVDIYMTFQYEYETEF